MLLQGDRHSPGQAMRLHTLSSGVSLPDSDSEDENAALVSDHMPEGVSTQDHAPVKEQDPDQATSSDAGGGSDDDTASSISGMSGVSSVAPTEVVDGGQDGVNFPGKACMRLLWAGNKLPVHVTATTFSVLVPSHVV